MKKATILIYFFIAFVLCSCEKLYTDPRFDQIMETMDKSQINKFDATFIAGNWVSKRVTSELYEDGKLVETQDQTKYYSGMNMSLWRDGSIRINRTPIGSWKYAHNHLIYATSDFYFIYEVVLALPGVLILKSEERPTGIPRSLIAENINKGRHYFTVIEYVAE
ncbi:MAG: hypothetical protein J5639_07520 [Bacteroidales bacterium]|nr:hypothetical protein [Bacteroidales bacterium]